MVGAILVLCVDIAADVYGKNSTTRSILLSLFPTKEFHGAVFYSACLIEPLTATEAESIAGYMFWVCTDCDLLSTLLAAPISRRLENSLLKTRDWSLLFTNNRLSSRKPFNEGNTTLSNLFWWRIEKKKNNNVGPYLNDIILENYNIYKRRW